LDNKIIKLKIIISLTNLIKIKKLTMKYKNYLTTFVNNELSIYPKLEGGKGRLKD